MATVNAVGNSLTGSTGSGSFVGATSPTLVTPTLGVASATSINFGGGALSTYIPRTSFTPTFTFATPGDLSVSYATQVGFYSVDGDSVVVFINMAFTPTFSTASGDARIVGLPSSYLPGVSSQLSTVYLGSATWTWPAGRSQIFARTAASQNYLDLVGTGSGVGASVFSTTNLTSASQHSILIQFVYLR